MADEFLDHLDDIAGLARNRLASGKIEVDAEALAGFIRTGDRIYRSLFAYFMASVVVGAIITAPLTVLIVGLLSQPAGAAHANPAPGRRTK